jgi:hypothetical protein
METFQFSPFFATSGASFNMEPGGLGFRGGKLAIDPGSDTFSGSFTVIHKKALSLF